MVDLVFNPLAWDEKKQLGAEPVLNEPCYLLRQPLQPHTTVVPKQLAVHTQLRLHLSHLTLTIQLIVDGVMGIILLHRTLPDHRVSACFCNILLHLFTTPPLGSSLSAIPETKLVF